MDETGLVALPTAATQSRLPPARRYILRVKQTARASAALGFELPLTACTSVSAAAWSVLWLGPDEFLLIAAGAPPPLAGGGREEGSLCATGAADERVATTGATPLPIPLPQGERVPASAGLRALEDTERRSPDGLGSALTGIPHSLVEVSDRQVAIALTGPRLADVVNAGCPLNLDPASFPVGMCTRTVFAKAEIVLWREAEDRFRIEVWRSFADYVTSLLDLVIAEYACGPAG